MLNKQSLHNIGVTQELLSLPEELKQLAFKENWQELEKYFASHIQNKTGFYQKISSLLKIENIEYMLALRLPPDEDGIWHDDGSRELGFSISLCLGPEEISGGEFCFKSKTEKETRLFKPGEFGTLTCFRTGKYGFEHKVSQVLSGRRLMFVGWCNSSLSSLEHL